MNVPALGSEAAVVFGLASALTWGTADFGGGLTTRRASVYGVTLVGAIAGLALSALLAFVRSEAPLAPADVGWSVAAGFLGSAGILGLYSGLAMGRMGVVAPVTGVLAATIPVAIGIVLQGVPAGLVVLGIALAIVAVVLVSRAPDHDDLQRPSGIRYALVAGLGLGLFNVAISRVGAGHVFAPLMIVRVIEALVVAGIAVAFRRPWRVPRSLVPAVLGVGILDMSGNGLFVLAAQAGPLAVAAVLSSLYPVTTVILATVVLRERLTKAHAVGVAMALVAIALIGTGAGSG